MSDTPEWKGRRIGPYQVGERYRDIPEDEGRLHEARHVETGQPALVVMPGPEEDWSTHAGWSVRLSRFLRPDALVLHVEPPAGTVTPSFHGLTVDFIRMAGALASMDMRRDARAWFTSTPPSSPPPPRTPPRGLALGGLALAVGLALLLGPRAAEPPRTSDTPDESIVFSQGQPGGFPAIAYPMPEKPFKEQRKPPCVPDLEVEVRGGCWILHTRTAPCPRSSAEFQGRCYVPVKKPDPEPSSLQP